MKLLSDSELRDDGSVALDVNFFKVVEQTTTLTYHLEQTAARMTILLMGLEMLGEVIDALSEECDLNLWGTRIALVESILIDDFIFAFFFHFKNLLYLISLQAAYRVGASQNEAGSLPMVPHHSIFILS